MVSLVGKLDDNYGSIHDEELVLSLATMERTILDDGIVKNIENNSKHSPGMNTKKLLLGMMGLTAVVVSGASLFYLFYSVIMDSSGRQTSTICTTEEAVFLLNDRGGADDNVAGFDKVTTVAPSPTPSPPINACIPSSVPCTGNW